MSSSVVDIQEIARAAVEQVLQPASLVRRGEYNPIVSFRDFKEALWPGYIHAEYLELIDQNMMQVAEYLATGGDTGIDQLMINMPPRYGKSSTVAYFMAWLLGNWPWLKIITASYSARRAHDNSRAVRNMMLRPEFQEMFPHIQKADKWLRHEWELATYGGGVLAAGVGGGIAGFGANLLVGDDLVKGRAEAESPVQRGNVQAWWRADYITRLEKPAAKINVNTLWHSEDLNNVLAKSGAWAVVKLPGLAEENDMLGREVGEPLWEERHTREELIQLREEMGEYDFAALIQQNPIAAQGRLFDVEKISIVDHVPEVVDSVRFWDLAVTAKARASYTVGLKLGVTSDERFVILDVYRAQKELPEIHQGIKQCAVMDGVGVRIRLEAEKGGIVELQHLHRDRDMRPYTMDSEAPKGDKYTRAGPVAAKVNAGRVLMVRAQWNQALRDELSVFPGGANTDIVDALSGAYKMVMFEKPANLVGAKNPFYG